MIDGQEDCDSNGTTYFRTQEGDVAHEFVLDQATQTRQHGVTGLEGGGFLFLANDFFFFFAETQLDKVVEVLTTCILSAKHEQRRVVHDGAVARSPFRCCALCRHWLPRLGRYVVQQSQTQTSQSQHVKCTSRTEIQLVEIVQRSPHVAAKDEHRVAVGDGAAEIAWRWRWTGCLDLRLRPTRCG